MRMDPQKMAAILQRVQLARPGGAGGPPDMPMQGTPPMGGPPKMPGLAPRPMMPGGMPPR